MKIHQKSGIILLVITSLWSEASLAGVVVGGTRVVYNGGKREASLSVRNPDQNPYLIQTWADANGPSGETKSAQQPPFVVTPPVFRLDAGKENMVRIIRTGGDLPEDRESIYWMNIKSIPASSKNDKNVLQISVKTRIKLIYRPEGVHAPTEDDYRQVSFHRAGNQIQIINPTSYYLSFFSLNIGHTPVTASIMVPPKDRASYPMPSAASGSQVTWRAINDFGGNSQDIVSSLQ